MIDKILDLASQHKSWRERNTINLIPSENVTSPMVRSLLSSTLDADIPQETNSIWVHIS
jgi:glycine/serine hydroxymethyltransferase